MRIVTLDFESFFDRKVGYSLKNKNVGLTTEDYVADARFEEIMVSAKENGGPTEWFSGTFDQMDRWVKDLDLPSAALLCQNTRFDGSILAMRHGIIPAFYLDTLAMATPFFKPLLKSLSLGSLVEHLQIGTKGDEVVHAEGKRRCDFSPWELERYAAYCVNDTELTYKLYQTLLEMYRERDYARIVTNDEAWMKGRTSSDELRLIDMTIRMYTQPQLQLHAETYFRGLNAVRERKAKIIEGMELQGITKKMLGSGPQFAKILRDRGIDPPMKESPASLKRGDVPVQMTYAFGKADPEFIELKEEFEDDLEISTLLNARTETKSTQEEKRNELYLRKANNHLWFRAPKAYYGAHTGRYVGTDGENVLNLTNPGEYKDEITGEKRYKSTLRFGIVAPPDHDVLAADLSQIEARITAALAGQADLIEEFRAGGDPYSSCASGLFRAEVSKELAKTDPVADKRRKCGKEIILGAGFGMGPPKFRRSTRSKGLNLSEEEAFQYIHYYRDRYSMIPKLWGTFDDALYNLVLRREESQVGPLKFVWLDKRDAAMVLPNGMNVLYPRLRMVKNPDGRPQIVCQHARDKFPRRLWGGVITENAAQSLARIIIVDGMLAIRFELGYRTALQIYDEAVLVIPKDKTKEVQSGIVNILSRSPVWMPDLPVGCESKAGPSYGHV